jgi:predicted MFS family arabinose efflux permease
MPPLALLLLLGLSAIIVDMGVIGDQTLGRRAINLIRPEARGRLNGLFVGLFFIGGSVGSALAGVGWASGGWPMVCAMGAALACTALVIACFERRT